MTDQDHIDAIINGIDLLRAQLDMARSALKGAK